MLRLSRRARKPEPDPEPGRTGRILGLSPTGYHEIAYVDWGPALARVPVICVHGLSRQGRDFDFLAASLAAAGRRVMCPDLVGRGLSGRLRNPNEYAIPQYCSDMNALIAHSGAQTLDWIGTSLGGLVGIVLAGLPGSPIRRLVVNDIGPYVPWGGLARIGSYVSATPAEFRDLAAVEAYLRTVLAPYGDLSDAHWRHIARHSATQIGDRYVMLCDPQIVRAFRNPWHYSLNLWKYWKAIEIPILVLRGVESDMLPADLAHEMVRSNPRTKVLEIAGCGHAPSLMSEDQIDYIAEFLSAR